MWYRKLYRKWAKKKGCVTETRVSLYGRRIWYRMPDDARKSCISLFGDTLFSFCPTGGRRLLTVNQSVCGNVFNLLLNSTIIIQTSMMLLSLFYYIHFISCYKNPGNLWLDYELPLGMIYPGHRRSRITEIRC